MLNQNANVTVASARILVPEDDVSRLTVFSLNFTPALLPKYTL